MWCVVNTIVSWLWRCQEESQWAAKWMVSSGLSSISCLGALNIQCFCLVDDMMAGKRFYMTASVAREHTNKLWENEGNTTLCSPSSCLSVRGVLIIIHSSSSSLNCHYRLFFEVPFFWSRGNAVTAGRSMFRPVFPGNAGGSTMQVQLRHKSGSNGVKCWAALSKQLCNIIHSPLSALERVSGNRKPVVLSVGLSGQGTNCSRSTIMGSVDMINVLMSLLQCFITTEVRAMGLKSMGLLGSWGEGPSGFQSITQTLCI